MNEEDWLRSSLQTAVPTPPGHEDRLSQVHHRVRHRRRRHLALAGTAIVITTAAALVGPTLLIGQPQDNRKPPLADASPAAVGRCPSGPDAPVPGVDVTTDAVPQGATQVRLCLGPGNDFQEPGDALVSGVDRVADLVNQQKPQPTQTACTQELGYGYRLAFSYPDGRAVVATGELYGCDHLTVGDRVMTGSDVPWRAFIEALRVQRATAQPSAMTDAPACRNRQGKRPTLQSPVAVPAEMVTAVLCTVKPNNADRERGIAIPDDELALLLADLAANRDGQNKNESCRRYFDIIGLTAWGDQVTLSGGCGVIADYGLPVDVAVTYWNPGPDVQAILDRLYDQAEPLLD